MSSQPGGSAPRPAEGGSGGSAESIIPILFWCVAGAAVGPAALTAVSHWLMPRLQRSSSTAARAAADWWAENWVIVVFWVVAGFGLILWRVWARGLAGRRQLQLKALAEGLAPRMGKDWDPTKHLRVRQWRGLRPVVVQVAVTVTPRVMDREWKLAVTATVRDLLGRVAPIAWPRLKEGLVAWRRPPWVQIKALVPPPWWRRLLSNVWQKLRRETPREDSADDSLVAAELEEKLITALAGLVPAPRPRVTAEQLVVGYGETTRDQSPTWRARVIDQVSARLGTNYRAQWDRQQRQFVLQPVPELPHPIDWAEQTAQLQHLDIGPWVAPYGTDEDGYILAWQPGDREPHALFSGDPGTGKTEAVKALIDSLLLQGALVAIIDPKQQDFAEYLGRPGVICVATAVEDQVGALVDLDAEMMRRTSAKALSRLSKQYPELQDAAVGAGDARYHSARSAAPAQAAIDEVPLILVLDELTFHVAQVQEWWQRLSPPERAEWGAEKSRQAPMLNLPSRIVALARAIKIHVLLGMQRVDANNFGGSTAMRDNIRHMASMGKQSRIGSEMQWGDGRTGSELDVSNAGEGMSNGLRIDPKTGERLGRGEPRRFKAWYAADIAETPDFWSRVAAAAPDASLIRLPHVSDAARDPAAAAAALRARAYEEYGRADRDWDVADQPHVSPVAELASGESEPGEMSGLHTVAAESEGGADLQTGLCSDWDQLLIPAAELVVAHDSGSAAMLQRELRVGYERGRQLMCELESIGVVGPIRGRKARAVNVADQAALQNLLRDQGVISPVSPPRPELRLVTDTSDAPAPAVVTSEPDQTQASEVGDPSPSGSPAWETVAASAVAEGDIVQFGDVTAALVVEAPGLIVDDFDHCEVVRLVLDIDGLEEIVDLSEDDVIYRRVAN